MTIANTSIKTLAGAAFNGATSVAVFVVLINPKISPIKTSAVGAYLGYIIKIADDLMSRKQPKPLTKRDCVMILGGGLIAASCGALYGFLMSHEPRQPPALAKTPSQKTALDSREL